MTRSSILYAITPLAAFMLIGAGGGRVANSPAIVPYVCEGGGQAAAIYAHGGDFRHAKVMLTYGGRTTELGAAPTLYGIRYLGEPSAEEPRALVWSLRGERALLAEATDPDDVASQGRPIASCTRLRSASAVGHSPDDH